jgi:hypothetical protein
MLPLDFGSKHLSLKPEPDGAVSCEVCVPAPILDHRSILSFAAEGNLIATGLGGGNRLVYAEIRSREIIPTKEWWSPDPFVRR